MIPPLKPGEEPSEAVVREITNLFLDGLPMGDAAPSDSTSGVIPMRIPDGTDADGEVDLEALEQSLHVKALQMPSPERIERARASAESSAQSGGKFRRAGSTRRYGVIDLTALKQLPSQRGPAIGNVV
jgi:hypothetical protein